MKQKLAIARTLLHHPELIFLGDPTAGLDPISAAALRDDLALLAKCGSVTIFLTTPQFERSRKTLPQRRSYQGWKAFGL